MTIPKSLDYLYFNYKYNFTIIINGKLLTSDSFIRTLISSESEYLNYLNSSTQNIENYINDTTIIKDISQNLKDKNIIPTIPKEITNI